MPSGIDSRFEQYGQEIAAAMGHSDRQQPAHWYLQGLILPGERKSVEPMAARVCPHNVRAAHQSMHHLVSTSEWSDEAVLAAVARQSLPVLQKRAQRNWWIVDDTAHAKKGVHSVGVARQYSGRLGKTDNCQVAVSLSFANVHGSLPLAYQLYLPREWADDRARCRKAGVPDAVIFQSKGQIARTQIASALAQGVSPGIVLADAGYGDETELRDWLRERRLDYALNIRSGTRVWWGKYQPAPPPEYEHGRPRTRLIRDAAHQPIGVLSLAQQLPKASWRTVRWREGTKAVLCSRFARVRVRAAHDNRAREDEWLLIEWPKTDAEPSHYWLSTLPPEMLLTELVAHAKGRWMIERDYEELKSELGLSHYEGRNWRGFHHHATLCIAAYGFLMRERLRGKKNAVRLTKPAVPKSYRPRGNRSDATTQSVVDRLHSFPTGTTHLTGVATMSLLRKATRHAEDTDFVTQ